METKKKKRCIRTRDCSNKLIDDEEQQQEVRYLICILFEQETQTFWTESPKQSNQVFEMNILNF